LSFASVRDCPWSEPSEARDALNAGNRVAGAEIRVG
jgi:hypothetical protein